MRLIIDVGCNVLDGFKKLSSIENINKDDRKVFVEANPECWHFLENEISKLENSEFIQKALDTTNRTVELITRADKKTDTAATILGKKFIEDSLNRWNIKVDNYLTYYVSTITIQQIIESQKLNFDSIILKLDAEGVEYTVLQQILDNDIHIDKIYCEFHVHNIEDDNNKNILIEKLIKKGISVFNWD